MVTAAEFVDASVLVLENMPSQPLNGDVLKKDSEQKATKPL